MRITAIFCSVFNMFYIKHVGVTLHVQRPSITYLAPGKYLAPGRYLAPSTPLAEGLIPNSEYNVAMDT